MAVVTVYMESLSVTTHHKQLTAEHTQITRPLAQSPTKADVYNPGLMLFGGFITYNLAIVYEMNVIALVLAFTLKGDFVNSIFLCQVGHETAH